MENNELLEKYDFFIKEVSNVFDDMFDSQKEYIRCKDGCSMCCEKGMYPFSKLEFEYLMIAFNNLPDDIKEKVLANIKELKEQYDGSHFMHCCPFLIDKRCSVYENRGIICRSFGLITENAEGNLTIPYCVSQGLNYSDVYDEKNKKISEEKAKELGYNNMPQAFNVNRNKVMELSLAKRLELDFGESKMLVEWLFDSVNFS